MIFNRSIYYMPKQTQVEYWENEWDIRDLEKQIEAGQKKAWWPVLVDLLENEVGDDELVVEAGCGMGQFVYLMHKMGKRVLGVDVTEVAISRTKKAYPELDLQVQDIRNFDLEDDSVKLMLSLGVVEHFIEGPQDPLKEAARVIKPGGILFITIPFTNHFRRLREPWWRLKYFFLKQEWFRKMVNSPELEFYQYTYSEGEVRRILKRFGFTVEKTLMHHAHMTVQKDEIRHSWWFKRLHKKDLKHKEVPHSVMKKWSAEQDQNNPSRFAHIALYVARRDS